MRKIVIIVFLILMLPGCESAGPQAPVLGVEPLKNVQVVDNHKQSYKLWQRHQPALKNEILVHIDTHLDLNWLSPKDLAMIEQETPFGSKRNEILTRDNFIYPAINSGLIKRIYWVVPDKEMSRGAGMLNKIKEVLNNHQRQIDLDDINSFEKYGGTYQGKLYQTKIIICNLHNLPSLDQDVLFDLDLDYFTFRSFYYTEGRSPLLADLTTFLEKLAGKKLHVKMATIATSISGGYTPAIYRFWGAAVHQYLTDPMKNDKIFWQLFRLRSDALAAYNNKDYGKAKEYALEAIKKNPGGGLDYYLLSKIAQGLGEEKTARAARQKSSLNDPFYSDILLYEARLAENRERIEEAEQLYLAYLKKVPEDPTAMVELANLLIATGKAQEAEEYAKLAWQADENYGAAHSLVGEFLLTKPGIDPNIPFTAFQRARKLSPEYLNFNSTLGDFYVERGQMNLAEKAYIKAAEKGPGYDLAYNNLGFFYANAGSNRQAEKAFLKALEFNPEHGEACFNLGQLYLNEDNVVQARYWLERAGRILPANPIIQDVLNGLPLTGANRER